MPIYEYACPSCGRTFEELCLGSSDTQEKPCPSCGVLSSRVVSNTSFILKGGGWFASSYGHGTSNLFDKTHGVPTVHDGKPASGGDAETDSKGGAAEAPAEKKDAPKTSGAKEQP